METKTNRRQFIKTVSTTMVMSAIPVSICNTYPVYQTNKSDCLNALIEAYAEDQKRYATYNDRYQWNEEDSISVAKNLSYAFERINPQSHDEFALVVACAWDETREYADEYVRRKNGRSSLLPDHPIFALDWSVTPNTQRLLLYNEQMDSLLNVLMVPEGRSEITCRRRFLRDEISFDEFSFRMEERFMKKLSEDETKIIYDGIHYFSSYAQSYFRCSSTVSHAFRRMSIYPGGAT